MSSKVKDALLHLAQQIVSNPEFITSENLYDSIRSLYEMILVARYLEKESSIEATHWEKYEQQLQKILQEASQTAASIKTTSKIKQESNSLEVPPVMDSIKNIVTEMPEEKTFEGIFAEVEEPPVFLKKDEEKKATAPVKKSLNDQFSKGFKIDINDRLAFIKNLFDGHTEAYEKAISQIASMTSWEEIEYLIQQIIKPDYNNWEGREAYEKRFVNLLKKNF